MIEIRDSNFIIGIIAEIYFIEQPARARGIKLPGYGIPFFVNSILGLITTIMLLALVKEPEQHNIQH
jgi:hypothetical protein